MVIVKDNVGKERERMLRMSELSSNVSGWDDEHFLLSLVSLPLAAMGLAAFFGHWTSVFTLCSLELIAALIQKKKFFVVCSEKSFFLF